ncbi:dihydroneopterin aldolase [Paraburkholderia sp. C35]|uniref:dihydroneopterin aldolase n=1 Tax=Paraburkholderia sp. C35 TaxID=2126993 RepID=UPI000D6962F7|nr:dihydroneopterin aldolase [Paraburkholderia sp. C35]
MKPFEEPLAAYVRPSSSSRGKGWRVFIDELVVSTRIGIHAHEHLAPQPVVIDASLSYRCEPSEEGSHAMIDYERYCNRVSEFLSVKPHTRLLETLAVEIAQLSFEEWPALDAVTLALYKPKIREGTRRIGIELDWTRGDFEAHRVGSFLG